MDESLTEWHRLIEDIANHLLSFPEEKHKDRAIHKEFIKKSEKFSALADILEESIVARQILESEIYYKSRDRNNIRCAFQDRESMTYEEIRNICVHQHLNVGKDLARLLTLSILAGDITRNSFSPDRVYEVSPYGKNLFKSKFQFSLTIIKETIEKRTDGSSSYELAALHYTGANPTRLGYSTYYKLQGGNLELRGSSDRDFQPGTVTMNEHLQGKRTKNEIDRTIKHTEDKIEGKSNSRIRGHFHSNKWLHRGFGYNSP